MFRFDITERLEKKLRKLGKRDKILAEIFRRKVMEIINQDKKTINSYKNLKSPMNEYKRIHLTDNFILLFKADLEKEHILFMDILHWDDA
ncbi:MAG: hypothetical protein NDI94_05425, partial [Candidatus Woesearchaeota archaeon]|nr:hypothetical protein [Candidatus Woesearchaeota archaeon]